MVQYYSYVYNSLYLNTVSLSYDKNMQKLTVLLSFSITDYLEKSVHLVNKNLS
jgi:hypothetical protein